MIASYVVRIISSRISKYVTTGDGILHSGFDDEVMPGQKYYYNFTVVESDFTESEPSGKVQATAMDTMAPNIYHTCCVILRTKGNIMKRKIFKKCTILFCLVALIVGSLSACEKYILSESSDSQVVPILLYHHLSETEPESTTIVTPDTFGQHMQLLYENGYHTVSFEDLIRYVEEGGELPENPVVITFDDGYLSNYEYAFPILQKYNYSATIFVIGCSIGQKYYKDTQYEMIPHFGTEEMEEMIASGLISIHSHTYDMHQWRPYETGDNVRENILQLENESEEEYVTALKLDVKKQDEIFAEHGLDKSNVLAFPRGEYSALTDEILTSCGYKVTVTTDAAHINTIVPGQSQTLIDLGRMNIAGTTTDEEILGYLQVNDK